MTDPHTQLEAARERVKELEAEVAALLSRPVWRPIHEAPTDGRKVILGEIARFVLYKVPQRNGRKGRWQVRDEYGKWSNCDRRKDYWLDGYKVDAPVTDEDRAALAGKQP